MSKFSQFLFLSMFFVFGSYAQQPQTQTELNLAEFAQFKTANAKLNNIYNEIQVKYKKDPLFL